MELRTHRIEHSMQTKQGSSGALLLFAESVIPKVVNVLNLLKNGTMRKNTAH
jgi:hypothetical protein